MMMAVSTVRPVYCRLLCDYAYAYCKILSNYMKFPVVALPGFIAERCRCKNTHSRGSCYRSPVKTVLQEICKFCKYISRKIFIISCKRCTKNEAFLARNIKSCNNFAQDNFLVRFWLNLVRGLARKLSCKFFLQDHFISCKKSFILSARLARYVQPMM